MISLCCAGQSSVRLCRATARCSVEPCTREKVLIAHHGVSATMLLGSVPARVLPPEVVPNAQPIRSRLTIEANTATAESLPVARASCLRLDTAVSSAFLPSEERGQHCEPREEAGSIVSSAAALLTAEVERLQAEVASLTEEVAVQCALRQKVWQLCAPLFDALPDSLCMC